MGAEFHRTRHPAWQSPMTNVISVCDREADIYEYLRYKQKHNQRFVVRSMQSRCIDEHDNKPQGYECQSAGTRGESLRMQRREKAVKRCWARRAGRCCG